MNDRKFKLHNGQKGSALAVRVTPRASQNEIVEIHDDGTIKVRLATSPAEGEDNEMLLVFLAEVLGVERRQLAIVAGDNGRDKLVSVVDMDTETAHERILTHLG